METAAVVIAERAEAEKPNMGLTTWAYAPEGMMLSTIGILR